MNDIVERLKETADGMDVPPEVSEEIEEGMVEITKLRDALRELVDALDRCKPGIDSAFSMAWVHGQRYDGPTYEKELEAARTTLGEE